MDAQRLLAKVSEHGVDLRAEHGRLLCHVEGSVPSELLAELREHKAEILEVLPFWCQESADAVLRFGMPAAWLLPHLGSTVSTAMGEGILIQVTPRLVAVGLDQLPGRSVFFDWREVRPVDLPRGARAQHA